MQIVQADYLDSQLALAVIGDDGKRIAGKLTPQELLELSASIANAVLLSDEERARRAAEKELPITTLIDGTKMRVLHEESFNDGSMVRQSLVPLDYRSDKKEIRVVRGHTTGDVTVLTLAGAEGIATTSTTNRAGVLGLANEIQSLSYRLSAMMAYRQGKIS